MFSFNLAKYIGIAVNNPKKFPKYPFSYKPQEPKPMTIEEMQNRMKNITLKLGGKIS